MYTDYFKEQVVDSLSTDTINMLQFYRQSSSFLVKPSLLSNSIFFKQGSLLRRDDRQKTFRKLNSLGTYRFVTVNARVDKDRDSIMNFEILPAFPEEVDF
ncbi:MAG: hypothetical protein IPJ13_17890 [Saprospiraceae bacterium]|nr:hypothetical protein [Saprospiraceae bacterium]